MMSTLKKNGISKKMYESRSRSSEDKDKVRRWHGRNLHTHRHIREILFSEDDGHTYLTHFFCHAYTFLNSFYHVSDCAEQRLAKPNLFR